MWIETQGKMLPCEGYIKWACFGVENFLFPSSPALYFCGFLVYTKCNICRFSAEMLRTGEVIGVDFDREKAPWAESAFRGKADEMRPGAGGSNARPAGAVIRPKE